MLLILWTRGHEWRLPSDTLEWPHPVVQQVSVAVNVFFGDAGPNTFLTKMLAPASPARAACERWLLNIVEQNRSVPSFAAMVPNLRCRSRLDCSVIRVLFTSHRCQIQFVTQLGLACVHMYPDPAASKRHIAKRVLPTLLLTGLVPSC